MEGTAIMIRFKEEILSLDIGYGLQSHDFTDFLC